MKKLLFTIAALFQVLVVMAQEPPMRGAAVIRQNDQLMQKGAAYNMSGQAVYQGQNANRSWVVIDIDGSMPNGRIPGPAGAREATAEKPHQEK